MHHRDAGKFKENITGRRLGLGLIRFIMVMYHLGNRLLQKNSCFLPVYWQTNCVLLPRKGASADFLICRISLRKPYKRFRKIFCLLTNPSSRLCFFLTSFPSVFLTSICLYGALNTLPLNDQRIIWSKKLLLERGNAWENPLQL